MASKATQEKARRAANARKVGRAIIASGGGAQPGRVGEIRGPGGARAELRSDVRSSQRAASARKKKGGGGGGGFGGFLQKAFYVLDTPRSAISAGLSEVQDIKTGKETGSWAEKTFDADKRVSGSEILERANKAPGWLRENKVGRGVTGFLLDVGIDPTTYVTAGTGQLAKKGGTQVAEEVMQSGSRLAYEAAKDEAAKVGREVIEEVGEREGKELAEHKLKHSAAAVIDEFRDTDRVKDILKRRNQAAAKVRREGYSSLTPEERMTFLTRETGKKKDQLARPGLGFLGKQIPGTDNAVTQAIGRGAGKAKGYVSDKWYGGVGGKMFKAKAKEVAAARSGNAAIASEAIQAGLNRKSYVEELGVGSFQRNKKFKNVMKGWSKEEKGALRAAIGGDEDAMLLIGDKLGPVKQLIHAYRKEAQAAGVDFGETLDYFPRKVTPAVKKHMQDAGLLKSNGAVNRESFEQARKFKPDQEREFLGQKIMGKNAAEVDAQLEAAWAKKLDEIDSSGKLKEEIGPFFSNDPDEVMKAYTHGLSRRIAEANAAQKMADAGFGGASRVTGEKFTEEQLKARALIQDALGKVDQRSAVLAERADEADLLAGDIEEHLATGRVQQMEADVGGRPIDEALTDDQARQLAEATTAGAERQASTAKQALDDLLEVDSRRSKHRAAAAHNLQVRAASLQDELVKAVRAGEDVARIEDEIIQLTHNAQAWSRQRDEIVTQALAGTRTGVIQPTGEWKAIVATQALNDAPQVVLEQQGLERASLAVADALDRLNPKKKGAATNPKEVWEVWDTLFDDIGRGELRDVIAAGATSKLAIDRRIKDLANDPIEAARVMKQISNSLVAHHKAAGQALDVAAKHKDKLLKAAERGPLGIPIADVFHSASVRLTDDAIDPDHLGVGLLDGPGFYLTTDKTGKISVGYSPGQAEGIIDPENDIPGYIMKGVETRFQPGDELFDVEPATHGYNFVGNPHFMKYDETVDWDNIPDQLADAIRATGNPEYLEDAVPDMSIGELVAAVRGTGPAAPSDWSMLSGPEKFLIDDFIKYAKETNGREGFLVHGKPLNDAQARDWMAGLYFQKNTLMAGTRQADTRFSGMRQAVWGLGGLLDDPTPTGIAQLERVHRQHLDADFGIAGFRTSGGGVYVPHGVEHDHIIAFNPSRDLELAGTSEYTARVAQQQVDQIETEIVAKETRLSDAYKIVEDARETQESLTKVLRDHKKYGTDPGAMRMSPKTRRAEEAARVTQEQLTHARQLEAETNVQIQERIAQTHVKLREAQRTMRGGRSEARRQLSNEYVDGLREGVKWGNVHLKALEVGDAQLARLASLEEASALARSEMADLHQEALGLQHQLGNMSPKSYEYMSDAIQSGLHEEIKRGIGTPAEMAAFLRENEVLMTADSIKGVMKRYDAVVGWIKDWQIATPGFTMRNTFGGVWNNALADVKWKSYVELGRVIKASRNPEKFAKLMERNPEWAERWVNIKGHIGAGQVRHEFSEVMKEGGIANPLSSNFFYIKGMKELNTNAEFVQRAVLAWDVMAKGGTMDDAVSQIHKYHFDYSDLSKFEQGVKKVIPFYTWTRKNLPLQLEQLVKNPRVYQRYNSARQNLELQSEGDPITASYFGEIGAVRLPMTGGGGHKYLTPDLPFKDIQQFTTGGPIDTLRDVTSMASPVLKTPFEMMTNQQTFKGLPLTDDPTPLPLPAMLTKGVAPALEKIGLAKRAGPNGEWVMTEKNAYVLEQFMPMIARYRRLMPNEDKYEDKRMTSIMSTVFGIGMRTNTRDEQETAAYYEGKTGSDKLYKQLRLDLVGAPKSQVDRLWREFYKAKDKVMAESKKKVPAT